MRAENNVTAPLRLIISGGIGSGKSTVLSIMRGLGVQVIEADRIGHAVLEPGGGAFQGVVENWPTVVREGKVDRGLLATIVFSDKEELRNLEALTHPHIATAIRERVDAAGHSDVAVELPLKSDLLGEGWTRIVVDAGDGERLRRAVARGLGADDASRRMAAQPARAEWVAGADFVVDNSGTMHALEQAVTDLLATLRRGTSR